MQVTMDGEPVADLPVDWERFLLLSPKRAEVTGFVLDAEAAGERSLAQLRVVCACGMGLIWLVTFGLAHVPGEGPGLVITAWVLAGLGSGLMVLAYYARRKALNESLPERTRKLPPPGTKIRVDPIGLTIGERSAAWRDVAVDGLDYERLSGRYGTVGYFIKKIDVRTKDLACTLDVLLLQEGAAILAETYRQKVATTA